MVQSKATTVAQYLKSIPADRRKDMETVRAVILKNLPKGMEEVMNGMIVYVVPYSIYPAGYHCPPKQPLPFAGLAAQKHHLSIYLMYDYDNEDRKEQMRKDFAKAGKKLDMGKSCIRFTRASVLPLDVIGKAVGSVTVSEFIEWYERTMKPATRKNASSPKRA